MQDDRARAVRRRPPARSSPNGIFTRSIASGPMNALKTKPRKKQAMAYIVNGLMAQLTNSVSQTGLPLLPALMTEAKSIFTMMGYIMKNRQMAMGMETTGAPLT